MVEVTGPYLGAYIQIPHKKQVCGLLNLGFIVRSACIECRVAYTSIFVIFTMYLSKNQVGVLALFIF